MTNRSTTVVLVSCSKSKQSRPALAKDIYISERFKEARRFAEHLGSTWFVLSAKYGLVSPDTLISPYDENLDAQSSAEKKKWAAQVFDDLDSRGIAGATLQILASGAYCKALQSHPKSKKYRLLNSFDDLAPGVDLEVLKRANLDSQRLVDYDKFYSLIDRLQELPGQMKPLGLLSGKEMPKAGVYFFFDKQEHSRFYAANKIRIVRIGTHGVSEGSKSTLWQRLKTHRGNEDLSGNHRSSVFRRHVGAALCAMHGKPLTSWGVGSSSTSEVRANEAELEQEVSEYLSNLFVAHLPIFDKATADSDRSYIEKNSISLLTGGGALDIQSSTWLGNFSPSSPIRNSGMWNINYVGETYEPRFLTTLEELIHLCEIGQSSRESLAPANWRTNMQRGCIGQEELF